MNALSEWVDRFTNVPTIVGLFIVAGLCLAAFRIRGNRVGARNKLLDGRRWYTPSEVCELMENLKPPGRHLYAWTQLTLDVVFPLVYGLLLAIAVNHYCAVYWLFLPMLVVIADLMENFLTAYLALSYRGQASPLAWISAVCTATKWIALNLCLAVILIGFLLCLLF